MTRRSTAAIVFVTLCVIMVAAAVTLNIGWILVNGRRILPLVLGVIAFTLIIAGIIVYTVFLVRELRRNDQHDAFINAVTHELKTPIASIRLYLETLQARDVNEAQRREFYDIMLTDTYRLQQTVEQVLKAGVAGQRVGLQHHAPVDIGALAAEVTETARLRHHLPAGTMTVSIVTPSTTGLFVDGDAEELRTVLSNLLDNAVKYSRDQLHVGVEVAAPSPDTLWPMSTPSASASWASTEALPPDEANSGRPNSEASSMSVVRVDRTGPTGSASVEWKTAASRLRSPSTCSSITMSARSSPAGGRAASTLSILTNSAGRSSRRSKSPGSPVSGATSSGGAVVVGAVVLTLSSSCVTRYTTRASTTSTTVPPRTHRRRRGAGDPLRGEEAIGL